MANNHRDTDRTEYYSDAVIAIASTLLAMELPLPRNTDMLIHGEGTNLLLALGRHWPSYGGFLVSFLFIGIAWSNHHDMFRYIRRTDHTLLILNLLFLMGIVLYPFTTALVVAHFGKPTQRNAVLVYYGVLFMTTLFYNAMWWYAVQRKLLNEEVEPDHIKALKKEYALAPLLHLVALAIAVWSVAWSLIPLLGVYIGFALPRVSERGGGDDAKQDEAGENEQANEA